MKTRAEERWEQMQQLLAREASGYDGPVKISSQRTLFGIKSHVEEVIEKAAAEDTQKCMDKLSDKMAAPQKNIMRISRIPLYILVRRKEAQ